MILNCTTTALRPLCLLVFIAAIGCLTTGQCQHGAWRVEQYDCSDYLEWSSLFD